ncbi:uncharacterized protein SCHCODRAFT_02457780, partial [Schizophyllum commune H4-8]|uniref:uncharacterized protein n=1 Tax=Schizophyllum commune (strain H4-8 / FGSC 9210) TaxID=578458 RepID=UPI00215F5A01
PKITRPRGSRPPGVWRRVGSVEGRPSGGIPGVASRRPSMRRPKDNPVARPR